MSPSAEYEYEEMVDAKLMREALTHYTYTAGVQDSCELLGISRFEYAHEYCLNRYRRITHKVVAMTTATAALASVAEFNGA